MKGTVLSVETASGRALISGDDGARYAFSVTDWKEQVPPYRGQRVDFVAAEGQRATEVYVAVEPAPGKAAPGWSANVDARYRGFYCSTDEKVLLGLCGGLAHKFDLDIAYVRTGVVLLGVFVFWLPYLVGFFLPRLPTRNVPRPG
jgi:phage shock protein PspC (stress-responsive transcriptional regulator)